MHAPWGSMLGLTDLTAWGSKSSLQCVLVVFGAQKGVGRIIRVNTALHVVTAHLANLGADFAAQVACNISCTVTFHRRQTDGLYWEAAE